jgi:hypothetical protein
MRWVLGFVVMLVGLGFAAAAWVATSRPLTEGSTNAVGQHLLLGIREADRGDADQIITYRYVPGERFAVLITLRNTSPLPVTVGGQSNPSLDPDEYTGFWLEDLAANSLPRGTDGDAGVLDLPPLPPTTIAPGEELLVWARYRIGRWCEGDIPWPPAPDWPEGESTSAIYTSAVEIRSDTFGIPQTSTIELRDQVEMVNGGPEALQECPTGA